MRTDGNDPTSSSFEFELEVAELTGDEDRRDFALLDRFPVMRPIDLALFGGWSREVAELTTYFGRPGDSDENGMRL